MADHIEDLSIKSAVEYNWYNCTGVQSAWISRVPRWSVRVHRMPSGKPANARLGALKRRNPCFPSPKTCQQRYDRDGVYETSSAYTRATSWNCRYYRSVRFRNEGKLRCYCHSLLDLGCKRLQRLCTQRLLLAHGTLRVGVKVVVFDLCRVTIRSSYVLSFVDMLV